MKALVTRPAHAFSEMKKPGAIAACALAYCAALLVSALFYGQLSQAQGLANPVQTTYLYRLSVEAGWGVLFNAVWFAFTTLLATAAGLPTAVFLPAALALPGILLILAWAAGPVWAGGAACGISAAWLAFAARRNNLLAPQLCLIMAVCALAPLAEIAAAAALWTGGVKAATALQMVFGLWCVYLLVRGLRFLYEANAAKAFILAVLPLLASYVALFSVYKAGFITQAALEVLTGF